MTDTHVFDVATATFEKDVVEKSREVPILLDFWAAWCGPCKTLTPVLEKLAAEYAGGFRLGKVDTEKERELGHAFQVQSIPFCVVLVDGRPVDAFAGALSEPDVRAFLERCGVKPGAPGPADEPEPEAEADPDAPERRLHDGLLAAARGDVAAARERLDGIPEEDEHHARAKRLLDGLEVFEITVDADLPHLAAIAQGRAELAAGNFEGAVATFLDSVAADRDFHDQLARRAAVLGLELLDRLAPDGDERTVDLRRRLGTLLY